MSQTNGQNEMMSLALQFQFVESNILFIEPVLQSKIWIVNGMEWSEMAYNNV